MQAKNAQVANSVSFSLHFNATQYKFTKHCKFRVAMRKALRAKFALCLPRKTFQFALRCFVFVSLNLDLNLSFGFSLALKAFIVCCQVCLQRETLLLAGKQAPKMSAKSLAFGARVCVSSFALFATLATTKQTQKQRRKQDSKNRRAKHFLQRQSKSATICVAKSHF